MNNALLGLAGLLIAVLAALFAVPYFVDWNGYRGVFEEEASRVLGRDVRVGGSVNVRLLPVPYVSFDKVRVADTANDTGDPFFRADSFTMWLSLPPLLRGQLEARRVELARPVLRLVVNPQGSGNWSTVKAQAGALPFVASAVALQSVRLRDGAIQVVRGEGGVNRGTLAELTGLDGEFEADTLDGPFRFKGTALWQDEARELRVGTTRLDADGGLRLKASVRVPASGNTYALDGHLADIRQHPRLDGDVTAHIGLQSGGFKSFVSSLQPAIEGKGRIEVDGTGLRLREIAASLENVGQPQLVSGEAQMAWVARPAMEARLASRLLDLDRIASGTSGASALDVARGLVGGVVSVLPAEADATVGLDVDQATLGGDNVSAVSVVLQRVGGQLVLKQMRAGVPGGGRVDLAGKITLAATAGGKSAGAKEPSDKNGDKAADGKGNSLAGPAETGMAMDGNVVLRGTSLNRFLTWAVPRAAISAQRPDSPFMLAGRLLASDAALQITEATAEIGKTPLAGSARLELGPRRRIAVRIDGRQINLGQLWPEAFVAGADTAVLETLLPGLAERLGLPAPGAGASKARAGEAGLIDLANTDIDARIQAGEVVLGPDTLDDVDADLSVAAGKLVVRALRATTADKLTLDVTGDIVGAGAEGKGTLRWSADAPSPAAVAALMRLAGASTDVEAGKARFGPLAPLRLAGTLSLSERGAHTTDIALDGLVGGGRIVSRLLSDAAPAEWRTAHLDATTRVDGADTLGLLRIAFPGMVAAAERGDPARRGQLFLKAVGVADKGLTTLATLDGEGLKLSYDGRWQVAGDGGHALEGRWQAKAADARALVALAGLSLGGGLSSIAVDGGGTITAQGAGMTLASDHFGLGASRVSGRMALTRIAGKPIRVEADLSADKASVAGLLAGLSASAPSAGGTASAPWPQEAIETRVLDTLDGRVVARFGRLVFEPGMALADAVLETNFAPGLIDVTRLEGVALGGKLDMNGTIEKTPAGVALKGHLGSDGVNLVALGSPEREAGASGPLKVTLDVSGHGSSAASVVGSLTGGGEVVAGPAEIGGFTPAALATLAEAAIAGKAERSGEGLVKAVGEAVGQGRFRIPATTVPVEVRDGVLKSKPLVIESGGGRTTLDVAAELATLKFDADWRVEPLLPKPAEGKPDKGPLPAVGVVYVGKLKDIGAINPRLDVAGFERELEVRKMEHDVEELERLRKLDEERARAEQERQRALDAERQRAAEAAAAAAAQSAAAAAAAGAVDAGKSQAAPAAGAPAAAPGTAPQGAAGGAPHGTGQSGSVGPAHAPGTATGKPGDWKTVETPGDKPADEEAVAKSERPPPRPSPAPRPRPKALTPEALFNKLF